MSTEKLDALQPGMDSKPTGQGTIALGVDESRTPRIPEAAVDSASARSCRFSGHSSPTERSAGAASLKLLDDTLPRHKVIGLVTQRDETKEDPTPQDLYTVGTAALVLKLVRQSEDNVLVIVQGLRRFSLRKIIATDPFCAPKSIYRNRSCRRRARNGKPRSGICVIRLRACSS